MNFARLRRRLGLLFLAGLSLFFASTDWYMVKARSPLFAPVPSPVDGQFGNDARSRASSRGVADGSEIPVAGDFRSETLYAITTTRFFNGDPTNDFYCRDGIASGDPHWRGDFAGIIKRLDYIRELGFSAIVLSPPVTNRGSLDFLGQNAYDWLTVDPRLESPGATYQHLIDAAHARGIKVIQQFVVNHSSNYGIRGRFWVDRLPHKFHRKKGFTPPWPYVFNWGHPTHPFREDNDNPIAPAWFQDFRYRDPWGAGPLTDKKTGVVLPREDYDEKRFFDTDEADLDPNWYHKQGWLQAGDLDFQAPTQGRHLDRDALDLATENKKVQDYLTEAVRFFRAKGIDGLELLFARHVDRRDLLPLVNRWREDHRPFFISAEIVTDGTGLGNLGIDNQPSELAPWWYSRTTLDPRNPDGGKDSRLAVFDHPLGNAFADSLSEGDFAGLAQVFANDWVYGDPTTLVTFFQTRDRGCSPDHRVRFAGPNELAALAYTLLWTVRGIPRLPAGDEFAFMPGALTVPATANAPLAGTGLSYLGDALSDATLSTATSHDLFRHLQRLNLIRARIPALQFGAMTNGREWGTGMSFIRQSLQPYPQADLQPTVVALSLFDTTVTVDRVPGGRYIDAVTGQSLDTTSGTLTLPLKGFSAGIWVRNGPGQIGSGGPFLR